MKNKLIVRSLGLLTLLIASLLVFSSCSKSADGNLSKEQLDKNLEATAIDDKDFTEFDEDLTSVDYKEFYDQLSPHGEWVQVTPEEIGLQTKTAQIKSPGSVTFSSVFGINDVYAADVNVSMVYVWKPSPDLAVVSTAGETPVYVPYTNGQWVNTDAGWYFKAPTPAEETVSHYGRWVNSPTAGWLWVPGRVWAPAWVDWKQNDNYVSWAPLPPSAYVVNGSMIVPVIDDNNYVVIERKYFLEPQVYKYNNVYYANGDRILISDMTRPDGIIIVNNTIVNRGPDVNIFQALFGRNIELVKIQHVRDFKSVRYADKDYYVYTHDFKRYKNKENKKFTINEPKNFKKYNDWNVRKSDDKDYKNGKKEYKKEEKNYKKEEKEIRKELKNQDNGKKNDGNYNGKKQDGNDNGKKNNGNDNGKKHEGNNNGKGKK